MTYVTGGENSERHRTGGACSYVYRGRRIVWPRLQAFELDPARDGNWIRVVDMTAPDFDPGFYRQVIGRVGRCFLHTRTSRARIRAGARAAWRSVFRTYRTGLSGERMTHPFSAFCDDFYVNMRLGSQLTLPHNRETLLHFFERVQKGFPEPHPVPQERRQRIQPRRRPQRPRLPLAEPRAAPADQRPRQSPEHRRGAAACTA